MRVYEYANAKWMLLISDLPEDRCLALVERGKMEGKIYYAVNSKKELPSIPKESQDGLLR